MRELATGEGIRTFLTHLSRSASRPTTVYLTGGATAVLHGWRASTVDVDIKVVPEDDGLLRAIPALKESLRINVELASPDQFIPVLAGWEDRSPFVTTEGMLTIRHFDLCAQALAKIERGHDLDREDVAAMLGRGLVTHEQIWAAFDAIEPLLHRFPAVDPPTFRRAVEHVAGRPPA